MSVGVAWPGHVIIDRVGATEARRQSIRRCFHSQIQTDCYVDEHADRQTDRGTVEGVWGGGGVVRVCLIG